MSIGSVRKYLQGELKRREVWCRINSTEYYLRDSRVSDLLAALGLIDALIECETHER